jgi:DNA-binding transcriptional regulator YiaG
MISSDRELAGQRIARARRRRGLSQAVLAGLVVTTRYTLRALLDKLDEMLSTNPGGT